MAAKATARAASPLLSLWLDSVESATIAQLEETTAPMASTLTIQEAAFKLVASSFMLGLIHAAEEEPGANLADDIIPAIAFEEALKFLSAKIPLTKAEWQKLEPRIRFRSFTIARLGFAHEIEKAKQILIKSLEDGTSYRDTWYDLKKKLEKNESIAPCYWENVYRTNTQSAYVAGKLEQYQGSGVAAYQLMVIEDNRTTAICRNLLSQASGYGAVIPVGDKFWTANGFPPYHYQCRTSIRGVWPSQLKTTKMDSAHTAPDIRSFEPMEGFGGNPVDRESWWRMTDSMAIQAANYGIFNLIEEQAKDMKLHNFSLNLVSGSDYRRLQGTTYNAEKAVRAEPLQKEINVARILEEKGHRVYFLPENKDTKNPDAILDGKTMDIKVITSSNKEKIKKRIKECDKQKVQIACLHLTSTEGYTKKEAKRIAQDILPEMQNVNEVCLIFKEDIILIKK